MERHSDRPAHLITRGNLDGIACAAVFLHHLPDPQVTFVTSPPAAARALRADLSSGQLCLADIPLTGELLVAVKSDVREVLVVDHHPTEASGRNIIIDLGKSAAGVLHQHLGSSPELAGLAALADLHERSNSATMQNVVARVGRERIEREAEVLDFAWRLNIEDDAFRLAAARSLSSGAWPSEVTCILDRWKKVVSGGLWAKAVERVDRRIEVRDNLGILDLRRKHESFHGFGSAALSAAAHMKGCEYTLLLRDGKGSSIASLRSTRDRGVDLGRFVEEFTTEHGFEGGGHQHSAGARIPRSAADILTDDLAEAVC